MKRLKKIGLRIATALIGLLIVATVAVKIASEPLPEGVSGEGADTLALQMLKSLNHEAYLSTTEIDFSFSGHQYSWKKAENRVEVRWSSHRVLLELDNLSSSVVYTDEAQLLTGEDRSKLINQAVSYFYNDSYWLVAPFKVFDPGVSRKLVRLEGENDALLVTHSSGGVTPGDSYLWLLDENARPTAFKMWVSIIPFGGLRASWEDYVKSETGAYFATSHKMGPLTIRIRDLKTETKRSD
jgi:hypothetical protein